MGFYYRKFVNLGPFRFKVGTLVRLRTRYWVVQAMKKGVGGSKVSLACADDDAQGEELEVVWEAQLDRKSIDEDHWKQIGRKGFDPARHFAVYVNTVRWSCVTATDARLFQLPFHASLAPPIASTATWPAS